jgi:hypothetical protein
LLDILLNLIAAAIGGVAVYLYGWFRRWANERGVRWFWQADSFSKIIVVVGQLQAGSPGTGEVEGMVNVMDALTLGQLRVFLQKHFADVQVTTSADQIDWSCPVVSVGGPLANALTSTLGQNLPLWFEGLPHRSGDLRGIGAKDGGEMYRSSFNADGSLAADVGFVARLRSPKNTKIPIIVVAGNYGAGTQGAFKLLTDLGGLRELRAAVGSHDAFQALVRTTVDKGFPVSVRVKTVHGL